MVGNLEFLPALDPVGSHPVDIQDRLLGDVVFLRYGFEVLEPFHTVDEKVIRPVDGSRLLHSSLWLLRGGRIAGFLRFFNLFLLRYLPDGNHQDLVLLQPFGFEPEGGIGLVNLLDGDPVSLADRIEGLPLQHHVGIVDVPSGTYFLLGHCHRWRHVVLGRDPRREGRGEAQGCQDMD